MSGITTAEPTRIEQARTFLDSFRGRYIVSQALYYGIQELDRVPEPYREVSNLNDMQYLREVLFNFPAQDNDLALKKTKEEYLIE